MLIIKLAFRNLMGAGTRTWLNVFVLSLAFVMIIWVQGLLEGMSRYAATAKIDAEVGGGHFWHKAYDPYDPFTFEESHAPLSSALAELTSSGDATPILIVSGAIYPDGRIQSAVLKGIDPAQKILNIPTDELDVETDGVIPAMIGSRMAKETKLDIGDYVTARWRDVKGTFDATDLQIVQVMHTTQPTIDQGQIWVPLERLREMIQAPGEASIVVLRKDIDDVPPGDENWIHHEPDFLIKEVIDMIKMKSGTMNILYALLLLLGLIAIFDTQVLSIWRRRREIGTLMALGMERLRVIGLFTFEGALHGFLALIVGAIYGIPIFYLTLKKGLPIPEVARDFGIAIPETMYPYYGLRLLVGTTLLVLVAVTIVSLLPTTRIAKLKPTEALRGKRSS
jgi:ABC-type lipoprotein release transport system permease subunit